MKKSLDFKKASTLLTALSQSEQTQIKGGLLLYCEEKRRNFLGISYTSTQWKLANDGKMGVTVKM